VSKATESVVRAGRTVRAVRVVHAEPLECADAAAWNRWLEQHHASAAGVWLRMAKKGCGVASVDYPQALEEALCHGWIDGQRKSDDATYFQQRFTPRTQRSMWSQINRDKVLKLIESGRMQAAGLAEVERAKADGRWDAAYEGAKAATMPPDLQAALDANAQAAKFFATLNAQNRYAVLFRTRGAKKPETRARRIEKFIEMLAKGEKPYP
jgi:uncharacterized protein YdeI (YjbR/CyaY-like superfamily)